MGMLDPPPRLQSHLFRFKQLWHQASSQHSTVSSCTILQPRPTGGFLCTNESHGCMCMSVVVCLIWFPRMRVCLLACPDEAAACLQMWVHVRARACVYSYVLLFAFFQSGRSQCCSSWEQMSLMWLFAAAWPAAENPASSMITWAKEGEREGDE